jgi:hypothetical protein
MKKLYLISFLLLITIISAAQCEGNLFEIEIIFYTNDNTEKIYWQIDTELDGDYGCNDTFLHEGGNVDSGCGDYMEGTSSGYASNAVITEGPFCISDDYHFLHIVCGTNEVTDAISVECYINGQLYNVFENVNYDFTITIEPFFLPPGFDSPCTAMPLIVDAPAVSSNLYWIDANINEIHPPIGGCKTQGFWCDTIVEKSVWYQFEVENGASYKVSTCGTVASADTRVAVYEAGLCNDYSSYTLLGANDNATISCSSGAINASEVVLKCLSYSGIALVQVVVEPLFSGSIQIRVEEIDPTPIVSTNVTHIQCRGLDNFTGYGKVVVNYSNLSMGDVFHWQGPNNFESSETTIDSLAAGNYSLTINQQCFPPLEYEFEITQPDTMIVNFTPQAPYCNGTEDGAITAEVIGGNGPLEYKWINPAITPGFLGSDLTVDGLAPDNYRFRVTDANDCVHEFPYSLEPQYVFEFDIPAIDTICINQPFELTLPEEYTYAFQCCFFSLEENILTIYPEQFGLGNGGIIGGTTYDENGCSNLDKERFVIVDCINVEEQQPLALNVYPNPFEAAIHIDLNRPIKNGTFEIVDSSGRTIKRLENLQGHSFDFFYDLEAGIYFVNMADESSQTSFRLIKQ